MKLGQFRKYKFNIILSIHEREGKTIYILTGWKHTLLFLVISNA